MRAGEDGRWGGQQGETQRGGMGRRVRNEGRRGWEGWEDNREEAGEGVGGEK